MDYGPFGVRFLFFNTKKERRSIDELLIYFATAPFLLSGGHLFILQKAKTSL